MDIGSVIIYLATFGLSSICVYLSEHLKCQKSIRNSFVVIGIFFVCLLAALRDSSVGSDVELYLVANYKHALSSQTGFWDYFNTLPIDNELLFALLIYISAKIGTYRLLCFFIELLVVCPVLYVLKKEKDKVSVTLGYTLFLLLFYNFSLSGMRASIAMSFFLLLYWFWKEKKYIKAIICFIISYFFQKTVLFMFIILIVLYLIEKSKKQKRILMRVSFIGTIFVLLIGYTRLTSYVIPLVNIINPRYGNYIETYLIQMPGFIINNIPNTDIIIKSAIVILTFIFLKKANKINNQNRLCFALCLMGRYFVIFNAVFYESMRIAYFFDYFILYYASLLGEGVGVHSTKLVEKLAIIFLALAYWLYFIMIIGGYATNVYRLF